MPSDQVRGKPNTRSGSTNIDCQCSCQSDLRDIKNYIKEINEKLQIMHELKDTVLALENTVTFISAQYDTLTKLSEEQKMTIQDLNNEVMRLKDRNLSNEKSIKSLTEKINYSDQYSRKNNLEIHGLHEVPNEDCKDIVIQLAKKLELPIEKADVDVAHRLTSLQKKTAPVIIAQFINRNKRDMFIQKKKICITDNTFPGTSIGTTAYFNENLSPYYKNLYRLTRIRARETNFQFVWFKNCKLFVRRNAEAPVMRINSEEDFEKFMS